MNRLPVFETIDRRIKYYEIMLERTLDDFPLFELPEGYHFELFRLGDCSAWIDIECSAKEFLSYEKAVIAWNRYYAGREDELVNRMVFLVTDSGEKIGTATAFYDLFGNDKSCDGYLHWVAIKREFQGLGLSKPLISHTLSLLKDMGYLKAKIPTQTTTWVACKVYLDFGFRPTKQTVVKNYDGLKILKRLIAHPVLSNYETAEDHEVLREIDLP